MYGLVAFWVFSFIDMLGAKLNPLAIATGWKVHVLAQQALSTQAERSDAEAPMCLNSEGIWVALSAANYAITTDGRRHMIVKVSRVNFSLAEQAQ